MKKLSEGIKSSGELLAGALDAEDIYQIARQIIDEAKTDRGYAKALNYFKVASEMGHPGAQNDFGQMLRNGYGCEVDIEKAIHWYEAAASQGELTAYYNLGTVYLHGLEDRLDYALAAKYLQKAAELGHIEACSDLGTMYRFGHGVERNVIKAAGLHLYAAQNGDYVAMANLRDYYQELVQPALNGSLDASVALHRIYHSGYAAELEPAITWAWIRWAHDVCLPRKSGSHSETVVTQVLEDYRETIRTIKPADRQRGDKEVAAWLAQPE